MLEFARIRCDYHPMPAETDAERYKRFGRWLAGIRDEMKLSRSDIVERAGGLSVSTIKTIEDGGRMYKGGWITPEPSNRTLRLIAEGYDVTLTDVFAFVGRDLGQAIDQPDAINLSSSEGIDFDELRASDPEGYEMVMNQARLLLERARERKDQG